MLQKPILLLNELTRSTLMILVLILYVLIFINTFNLILLLVFMAAHDMFPPQSFDA